MLLAQMQGNVSPGAGMPHLSQGSPGSYGLPSLSFGSDGSLGSPGNAAGLMLSPDSRQLSGGSEDSQDSPDSAGALPGLMLSPTARQGSLVGSASGLHMLPRGHENASGLEGLTLPLHGAVQGSPASSFGSPGLKLSLVPQQSTPAKSKESPAKVDFAVLEMPPPQQQELQPPHQQQQELQQPQEQSLATASPVAVLGDLAQQMDMLQAREAEKAAEKKAARALAAMQAREKNREADKKQQLEGVAATPPPKKPKVAAPKVAAAKKVPGQCAEKPAALSSKPSFSIERSRSQVLFRSGKGPGSTSKALKYGPGCAFADEAAAKKEAERMVAAQLSIAS